MQGPVQTQRYGSHIDNRRRTESIALIQRKRLTGLHALDKVCDLRLRLRILRQLLLPVGNVAYKVFIDIPLRTSDVRRIGIAIVTTPEHDLATILIRIGDGSPSANRIRMLLGRIHLHLHRTGLILTQEILHGVDVVLTHIAQATAIIIPVTTESLMHTVRVIGFIRSRAEPHIIIQLRRNRLRLQVFLSYPIELPVETCMLADRDLQRPT